MNEVALRRSSEGPVTCPPRALRREHEDQADLV